MVLLLQVTSILLLFLQLEAVKPPGYVKPPEVPDKNPPRYEYGYNIEDEKGLGQGKLESRDGIYALGRYYVQNKDSSHNVQYYADDWGYHPFIEYSSVGPHSKSRTQLLLGVEAVKALATNKFTPNSIEPRQHVADTINKINGNRQGKQLLQPTQPQQQLIVEQQEQPQQIIVEQQHQPQQLIVEQQQHQPQQLIVEQPQQVLVEQQHQPEVVFQQLQPPQEQQQQIFYVQQQEQPQTQSTVIQNNIVHETGTQQIVDEASVTSLGGYGSKINIQDNSVGLIQSTKNLVSGQDVLNINHSVDESIQTTTNIDTTTAKSFVTEYSSNIEHDNTQNLVKEVEINNQPQVTEASLIKEPIVVADIVDKSVSSTTENYINVKEESSEEIYSTTANTIKTSGYDTTEPSTILVTPRPVSTNFLAPITAGIQLQNVETKDKIEASAIQKENYLVEIQKSLPFYLGKFEYVQNPSAIGGYSEQTITTKHSEKAVEDIELGKTLLALPEPQALVQTVQPTIDVESAKKVLVQQLPEQNLKENFVEVDQQQAQGYHYGVVQQASPLVVEKIIEKKVPYPVIQTKIVEKPVEVTKVVNTPYPVQVPVHIPYEVRVPVEKKVPVPVTVEKIVEKPVTITKFVERPIHIPKPYPVERIVEKPVHVPVEVTRYVDRPYPVQVPVAQPVPYPVDRIVEKIVKQPYPVEVRVPVEVKVPVQVERIVEKKVPVPHYIEKQVPVEKIVEKPVPHYIDRPYPVHVQVPYLVQVPKYATIPQHQHYNLQVPAQQQKYLVTSYNNQHIHAYKEQQSQDSQQQSYVYAPTHSNGYIPPKQETNNGYLPPAHDCDQHNSQSSRNFYYTIKPDDYIGLLPPKFGANVNSKFPRKYRNARSNFNSNLRLEYGFMPPMVPSLEIDEKGQPIAKEEQK